MLLRDYYSKPRIRQGKIMKFVFLLLLSVTITSCMEKTSAAPQKDNTAEKPEVEALLEQWVETNAQPLERWNQILTDFRIGQTHEFAKFWVALRELMLLSLNCDQAK